MTHDHLYLNLLKQITPHTTVLTPNRRLSAKLHQLYQTHQAKGPQQAWFTTDILPLSSWIQRLWQDLTSKTLTSTSLLLNSAQELFIWENILLSSKNHEQLLQLSETADIARSAWGLLKQWQISIHHPIFESADDYLAFQHWAIQFENKCHENHWIDHASLPDRIDERLLSEEKINPLILVGFTEISPQLNALFTRLKQRGSTINHYAISCNQASCHRLRLDDQENEILNMARFAKETLAKNNAVSIGCVVPALDKMRDRVMQLFSEVFADENTYTIAHHTHPFNISAGKSLLHYPIIKTALQLLALYKHTIPIETMSYLLASPFLGEAEKERIKRARVDSLLRQANLNSIDLTLFTHPNTLDTTTPYQKSLSFTEKCPSLAKRFREFLGQVKEQQKIASYSQWATLFCEWLKILGWPGERSLHSDDYQVVDRWLTLLNEYTTLDQIHPPVPLHQAVNTLQKMASKTIFQPKTPEASIQVLGVLEAASLPFDYVWIASMDDLSWPPQPKPNPLIPKTLQRERQMPHATAERELLFCHTLIKQFKQSAKHIIFSHAEKIEELELQASPLIRDIPDIHLNDLNLPPYQLPSERIYASRQIDLIIDDSAPSLSSHEVVRGGVSVIKQQALCPFKAYAEWRLHAHELESPLPGLRAKDRGTILHKTLEILWNTLQDHATLSCLTENELHELIQTSIQSAMIALPHSHQATSQYIFLEKQRLNKLIWDWLQIEKRRTPFKVMTNEKSTQISLNQLTLSIRIDRVDELEDGKKLIIDYKTGKNNDINTWFSERPEEPQLPLYSLLDTDNTMGITFAQLSIGEQGFKGVSRYALDINGIKLISEIKKATALSWEEQLEQWNSVLTKLGNDFYSGIAHVDPKDPATTCLWCALKPLCRINDETGHEAQ